MSITITGGHDPPLPRTTKRATTNEDALPDNVAINDADVEGSALTTAVVIRARPMATWCITSADGSFYPHAARQLQWQ
ncbi:MAG: hypothetical protein KF778_21460 [Rhodocyclaceae bacterium]|nr:hypothetical protein [Rhodocyclaceae bacterium]